MLTDESAMDFQSNSGLVIATLDGVGRVGMDAEQL
jgi:hypothetical protein